MDSNACLSIVNIFVTSSRRSLANGVKFRGCFLGDAARPDDKFSGRGDVEGYFTVIFRDAPKYERPFEDLSTSTDARRRRRRGFCGVCVMPKNDDCNCRAAPGENIRLPEILAIDGDARKRKNCDV